MMEVAAAAGARKTVNRRVGGAFHSRLVGRAADCLRPALESVRFQEPGTPFMSTVTAQIESAERLVDLLVQQLTGPVKFTQAVRGLVKDGVDTFVEIGPGQVLSGILRRCDQSIRTMSVGTPEELEKLREAIRAAR